MDLLTALYTLKKELECRNTLKCDCECDKCSKNVSLEEYNETVGVLVKVINDNLDKLEVK